MQDGGLKSTRDGFGESLVEIAKQNEKIIVLDADCAQSTKTCLFKNEFKDRFFDCGISECNMIGVAAGLSCVGLIPIAASFAMFAVERTFEQIRNSVCYPNLNVKIVGSHAGLSCGADGATHQCCEDIAILRSLPNMMIVNPCDELQTKAALLEIVKHEGPAYLRLSKAAFKRIYSKEMLAALDLKKGITLKDGEDITIVSSGTTVHFALNAAEKLEKEKINARVIDLPTIKPIDEEIIQKAAKETKLIVVVEEHSIYGGLGDAVLDIVAANDKVLVKKLGAQDEFFQSASYEELIKLCKIDSESIYEACIELIKQGSKILA